MPSLLFEIGCEELPASACVEAEAQLRSELANLGEGSVFVGPRRLVLLVDDDPGQFGLAIGEGDHRAADVLIAFDLEREVGGVLAADCRRLDGPGNYRWIDYDHSPVVNKNASEAFGCKKASEVCSLSGMAR